VIAGNKPDQPYQNLSRAWIVARKYDDQLKDVRLHDLRHSYASLAASQGHSLQMIGKLLGHQSVAATKRYAHLTGDAAASVNDELGAVMAAAIEKGAPQPAEVVELSRRRKPR
jgi:integrase